MFAALYRQNPNPNWELKIQIFKDAIDNLIICIYIKLKSTAGFDILNYKYEVRLFET